MKISHSTYTHLLTLLFILIFTLPRTIQIVKVILLAILLVLFLLHTQKLRIDFIKRATLYSSLFILPLLVAVFLGNKTSLIVSSITTYILYPLVFLLLLQSTNKDDLLNILHKASLFSVTTILIIGISTLLFALQIIPFNLNAFFYPKEIHVGLYDGFMRINNSSLSYLIFIVPIYFYNLRNYSFKNPQFYLFAILLLFCIVTGRRILLLPFILVLLFNIKYLYKYIFVIIVFLIVVFTFNISPDNQYFDYNTIVERFEDAIYSRGDSEVREEQSVMFNKYISEKPLLGYGLGSYMKDYKRNFTFETAYERTYHYAIFSMGFLVIFCMIIFYIYCLRKTFIYSAYINLLKTGFIIGVISLLLASYTNPYWLSSFDYCLPLALLIRFSQNDNNEKNSWNISYI